MRNVGRWMVFSGVLVAGCVEQPPSRHGTPGVSQQEIEATRHRVTSSTAPTSIQHPLNFNFGNKVTLLGYNLTPSDIRPGTNMTVTWFWHCDAATGDGWHLFTHLDDASGPRQNHDSEGDVRRAYQPERWRAGEYITDAQTFDLPADWDSPVLKVHVGLWKNDERMHLVRGQADPDGRALAFTVPTGVQARLPEIDAPHASGPITIDGRLDEPSWRTAATTGPLVDTTSGSAAGPNNAHGSVKVLWDDQNLYLGWEVQDDNLVETTPAVRDAHYWENDTTEALIDPNGDGRDYYELQVSPGNHTFDSQQPQPPTPNNFGNLGWNPNLHSAVALNGTLGNEADTDVGYTVEVAIPFTDINAGAPHTPPAVGDTWRINFFLMDKPKQGGVRSAGWSAPRSGSFHLPDRFGRLVFRPAPPTVGAAMPGVPGAMPPSAVAPGPTPTGAPGAPPGVRPVMLPPGTVVRPLAPGARLAPPPSVAH